MSAAGDRPVVDARIARGAATNFLGTLAKLLHPAFLVLGTRLYGPAEYGLFAIATSIVEIAAGFVNAGWRDAVLLVGARKPDQDDESHEHAIYERLGHAVQAVILGSIALTGLALLVGAPLIEMFFPQPGIYALVMWMLPVLWCVGLAEVGIAATKLLMIMRYDVIVLGFLKPAAMVATALVVFAVQPDATGLAIAFTTAHAVLPIATWIVVRRHFSIARIFAEALRARPSAKLWGFALPQSANMAFVYFTTGVDVLLLAHFNVAAERIAYYKVATTVLRNVRQVKLSFAGAFNPVAARLFAERKLDDLGTQIVTVSRWSATLGHAILLLVVALHGEIFALFEDSFAGFAGFVVLLALLPALSNALGLAGNAIVMAGLSRWNLFNTAINVGVTLAVGYALIPEHGLVGAAIATMASGIIGTIMQVAEVRWILHVRLRYRELAAPNVALVVGALAGFATGWLAAPLPPWVAHVAAAIASLGVYVLVLRMWGLPPEDAAALRPWRRAPKVPPVTAD
jgi:O-antigen/teichoic acid export membrane protein